MNKGLSYNNVCLSSEDIATFTKNSQLNDMSISFYYEFLNNELLKGYQNYLLLDPAMVSILYFDESIEDLTDMLIPLNIKNQSYIFFPVNDNTNKYKSKGGTHWALMVYDALRNEYIYFDSLLSKIVTAETIASKYSQVLGLSSDVSLTFPESLDKRQFNTYDCGMFVLEFTESLIKYLMSSGYNKGLTKIDYSIAFDKVNETSVLNKRKEILLIISKLQKSN